MSDNMPEGLFGQYLFAENATDKDRARELMIKSKCLAADAETMKKKAIKLNPKLKGI